MSHKIVGFCVQINVKASFHSIYKYRYIIYKQCFYKLIF